MEPVYNLPSDTPAHIMKMQVEIVLKKTPLQRLQMCAELTEFSLYMLKRQILSKHDGISGGRLKFEMIKVLYADCFSDEEMTRIEEHFTNLD
jgi:hypothetical protein